MNSRSSHNQRVRAISEINSRCTRCGACLEECPNQAIVAGIVTFAIDTDFCDGHGNCIAVCPEGAIVKSTETTRKTELK